MKRTCENHRAFTLVELLTAVAILIIVAAVVVPTNNDNSDLRVRAAAVLLQADIEYAQAVTMAYPEDPVVLRLEDDGSKYWLAFESDPDTPIVRGDTGESYETQFGIGRASQLAGVQFVMTDDVEETYTLNATGGIEAPSTVSFVLTNGVKSAPMDIDPTTGSVTIGAVIDYVAEE